MIQVLKIFFFVQVLFLFASCEKTLFNDCYKGIGEQTQVKRGLSPIHTLNFNIAARIYITQDTNLVRPEIDIIGQKNVIEFINTEVDSMLLSIEFTECIKEHKDITFYLRTPSLQNINLTGSGEIYFENALKVDTVYCSNNNVGFMEIICNSNFISSSCTGPGSMKIDGITKTQKYFSNSSGNYRASGLESLEAFLTLQSIGNAEVFAADSLDINISGNGNISFLGNPRIRETITGNGKLIDLN